MKRIFLGCALLLSVNAQAATQAIFSTAQELAVIAVQGPQGDMDAPHLFQAMHVPAQEFSGTIRKAMEFPELGFSLICTMSKFVANFGSCTAKFYESPWTKIIQEERVAQLDIFEASLAQKFAENFVIGADGAVFKSDDGRVVFSVLKDAAGNVTHFTAEYKEQ